MTLTVPEAGASVGRTANVAQNVVRSEVGDGLAQLGQVAQRVGNTMEADRLSREAARSEVEVTADFNQLRLETEEIGDPDAMEAHWAKGIDHIRSRYQGAGEDGRPRISVQNRERFNLHLDAIQDRLSFNMGIKALGQRRAQREATFAQFEQQAGVAATSLDLAGREALIETGQQQIDDMLASGTIDAADAERRRQRLRGGVTGAYAETLKANPETLLAALDSGELDALGGEEIARLRNSATSTINTAIGTRLGEIVKLAQEAPDRAIADQGAFLSQPLVQGHPAYQDARAALALRDEYGVLSGQTPGELRRKLEQERTVRIDDADGNARFEMLESFVDRAETGWTERPIDFAAELGMAVPDLDIEAGVSDPAALTDMFSDRRTFAESLVEAGYTTRPVAFSDDEREALYDLTGAQADPDARMAVAQAAVAAGLSATTVSTDRDFAFGQEALETGMAAATVKRIFRGQAIIEERNVVLPPLADRLGPAVTHVEGFFAGLAGGEQLQRDVVRAADAIYATRKRVDDPTGDIDQTVYRQAIHEALGGTGAYNQPSEAAGGLQRVRDTVTVLPRGVTGAQAEDALDFLQDRRERGRTRSGRNARLEGGQLSETMRLISVDGRMPTFGGELLSSRSIGNAHMVAIGPDRFQLVWDTKDGPVIAPGDDGEPWTFSLSALVREAGNR